MDVTLTSFGGPGAPCTLLHSDALDLRVVLDCGATPTCCGATPTSPLQLRAPDVRALVASAAQNDARRLLLDPCPFADAVLLTSPMAVLGLPLLYRAALDASAEQAAAAKANSAREGVASPHPPSLPSLLPPLPLHTYATEACLEIAEHWIAELLDAEADQQQQQNKRGAAAPTTTTTTTTPLFPARDARRALACVRPVRFGERLALPGGGRVVAEALPASGARLGVCCWRLRAGATERLVYLGPCASLLKGHAAPLDLCGALSGACAVVLGPGAIAAGTRQQQGGNGGEEEKEEEEMARLLAEGRPRPPLLEQSLRGGTDRSDARHAAAVHRAARAALDAVVAASDAADAPPGATAPTVLVALDPTGAAFDFLEALEHEGARLARGSEQAAEVAAAQGAEDDGGEDEDDDDEEEGELEERQTMTPAAATTAATAIDTAPPVSVCYASPAAEHSLALAASAAEFLSPGRLSRVVRRAAAPFAHCRMMREGQEEEDEEEEASGAARRRQRPAKQRRRHGGPLVRLRVPGGGEGKGLTTGGGDIALVPASRFLAAGEEEKEAEEEEADGRLGGGLLILLGTAAALPLTSSSLAGRTLLRVPLPGERGLDATALLAACDAATVVIAAASQPEADALREAAAAVAAAPPAAVAVYNGGGGRAPFSLPPLPAPLYEAWLSGALAARVVLHPVASAAAAPSPPLSAARLPPVRLSVEAGGGGGGGAWRVDEEDDAAEVVAAVVAALQQAGLEVSDRRREEEEEEEEGGSLPLAVAVLAVKTGPSGGDGAEVRLAFSPLAGGARLRSVAVLSDDAPLRERLRELCEGAIRDVAVVM